MDALRIMGIILLFKMLLALRFQTLMNLRLVKM